MPGILTSRISITKLKQRKMKANKLFGFLMIVLGMTAISCGDDGNSITDLAGENEGLSTLVAALERADLVSTLDGDAAFTVFAPTNAAFDAFLEVNNFSSLEDIPVDLLRNVLLNHVVAGTTRSGGLSNGYIPTQATTAISSKNIDMYVSTDGGQVVLNGQSSVTGADLEADNGVVHIVNSVIVPATVTTFATTDPTFATLAAALTREADFTFAETLGGSGSFTVFAPTNDAFGSLLGELGVSALGDIPTETLAAVLSYHVVSGANVLAGDLTDGQTVTPLAGGTFEIDLDSGAQIIDGLDRVTNIVVTDVQAANGVVHAVDQVILPGE